MHPRFGFAGIARFLCVAIFMALNATHADAQTTYGNTYSMDPSFTTLLESDGGGVNAVVATSDGGFIVGGNFSTIGGQHHLGLAKFKSDGTVNPAFNQNTGFDGPVTCLATQADGHILVAGHFSTFDGDACAGIARLNADGTQDPTFNSGLIVGSSIYAIAVQADGKIVVGGQFAADGAAWPVNIARLNADGSIDTHFNAGNGFDRAVVALAVQVDGRIVAGGYFSSYNGATQEGLARLNPDGTLDTSFVHGAGSALALALQPDGKILAAGAGGIGEAEIARLNPNGTPDSSFNPWTELVSGFDGGEIASIAVQADGKILVGGSWATNGGGVTSGIVRLSSNGSLDGGFNVGTGYYTEAVALLANGSIAVGGTFGTFNGIAADNVVLLSSTGAAGTALPAGSTSLPGAANAVPLANGKFLVGGIFNSENGMACNGIARLNADGTFDPSFNSGTGFRGTIYALAVQADGKVLVGGYLYSSGNGSYGIVRLNTDGTLDSSFNPSFGFDVIVDAIAVQPDGRIIIGGSFFTSVGTAMSNIARLNADGTLDTSFQEGAAGNDFTKVNVIVLQLDGKIIAVTSDDYSETSTIARLNSNGTPDSSFNFASGFGGFVNSLVVQPDGRMVVGGFVYAYNGFGNISLGFGLNGCASSELDAFLTSISTGGGFTLGGGSQVAQPLPFAKTLAVAASSDVFRLNPDGTLDPTFNLSPGFEGCISSLALQADGKIVAAGYILPYDGAAPTGVVRLNPDGSLDGGFAVLDLMWPAEISGISLLSDGRLLVSGSGAESNGLLQMGVGLFKPAVTSSTPTSTTPAPASSGGGAMSDWFLATLVAAAGFRYDQRRRRPKMPA